MKHSLIALAQSVLLLAVASGVVQVKRNQVIGFLNATSEAQPQRAPAPRQEPQSAQTDATQWWAHAQLDNENLTWAYLFRALHR